MNIAFVTAELAPFAKEGGLGDVAAALPREYRRAGHHVRVYAPYYTLAAKRLELAWDTQRSFVLACRGAPCRFGLYHHRTDDGVDICFLRCDELFARPGIYGENGGGYPDNLLRFALFQQAVIESCGADGWIPRVMQLNDWHTALMPLYLMERRKRDARFAQTKTVFTIHNLAFQGVFPSWQYEYVNLPVNYYTPGRLEHFGEINCMKAALANANMLTTVSPAYALEIQTGELGCGFDGLLRRRRKRLLGILNGIDTDAWNPAADPAIPAAYTAAHPEGKAVCKAALQREMGLAESPDTPLIGVVARLTSQKGIDLILEGLQNMLSPGAQIAVLGKGDPALEAALVAAAEQRPAEMAVRIAFDERLSHLIEAGADMFLMPSRFEPCGLNQMYSLRYGTVPIVRNTGGLADTVVNVTPETLHDGTANGFVFNLADAGEMVNAVHNAITLYRTDRRAWRLVQFAGMMRNMSWARRAAEYLHLFRQIVAPGVTRKAEGTRLKAAVRKTKVRKAGAGKAGGTRQKAHARKAKLLASRLERPRRRTPARRAAGSRARQGNAIRR
ncbi:glycogen synthase GlgA [bacterium]|nr:glycogen synthase GlgA [bacterium]